jgi:hypothetical protein
MSNLSPEALSPEYRPRRLPAASMVTGIPRLSIQDRKTPWQARMLSANKGRLVNPSVSVKVAIS